jgi:hypothetical protein
MTNKVVELVNQVGTMARNIPGFLDQVRDILRRARRMLNEAQGHIEEARRLIRKAHDVAPDAPAVRENHSFIEEMHGRILDDLRTINNLCSQVGA